MNTKTKILLCAGFILSIGQAAAQTDSTRTDYHESVIVVGDYNPVLDGLSEKINVAPSVNENDASSFQPQFSYSITPRRISSLTATSSIKAAKVVGSPTRLYNNYLRFGLGHDFVNLLDFKPLVDLYYTSTREKTYAYGARLFHQTDIATFGHPSETVPSPDFYGRNRRSISSLDLFGKYILKQKHLFSANLAFDREYNRYYGFSDSTLAATMGAITGNVYSRDDISFSDYALTYNNIALSLGAKSLNTDVNKLGYEADVKMADLWGRYDFSQLSMELDANVHYGFPMFEKYKAIVYMHFNWQGYKQNFDTPADLPLGYDAVAPDSCHVGRNIVSVNPYVDFLFNGFKIHAGFSFDFNAYDAPGNTAHHFLPDVVIAKSFMNNSMSFTAGFQGRLLANDWNSIRTINPYVAPAPFTLTTVDNDLYAHLRLNFSKKLMLNVTADNHFMSDGLFFCLDQRYKLGNVFKPYFLDVNNLDLGADFTFVNDEMITMVIGANYYAYYGMSDNAVPLLHAPRFTAHLDADVNYENKWLFSLNTLLISKVDAQYGVDPSTGGYVITETLPMRIGVAAGVEYIHSKALSLFAKFDNILAQRYFYWANYPASRFNMMVGLTYTIPTKKK